METDTIPPPPIPMTSNEANANEGGMGIEGSTQLIMPLNPISNITNQTPFITPMNAKMQTVDEAFVMANYTHEDVDEEREIEAPLGFQTQPLEQAEEPVTKNTPATSYPSKGNKKEKKSAITKGNAGNVYPPNNVYTPSGTYIPNHAQTHQVYASNYHYPPNQVYPPGMAYHSGYSEGGQRYYEESSSPLTKWIEEYQFLDGIRVPPHVGYYDGKGDPNDFIHAFEGAIKWKIDETAQITRLNEDQRIAGFVHRVNIKSLVKFISTELPEGYNEHMEKEYSWLQAEETASKGRPVTFIDGVAGEKPQKGRK
ncbi:hypothetical protein Tco_1479272 [Tanacetum coccineum]